MATNWKIPVAADVSKVLSLFVQQKSNENINAEAVPDQPLDPDQPDRAEALLVLVVEEIRGALVAGGRIPLSKTVESVPPESEAHALSMVAYRMVNSMPTLQMVLLSEGGIYAPLAKLYNDALEHLKQLRAGQPVTQPTDPEDTAGAVPDTGGAGDVSGDAFYQMTTD